MIFIKKDKFIKNNNLFIILFYLIFYKNYKKDKVFNEKIGFKI